MRKPYKGLILTLPLKWTRNCPPTAFHFRATPQGVFSLCRCKSYCIYCLPPVFRCKYDTILNHTDLYEYKHGQMLIHLKFCFEGLPTKQTPAAMLKYYRQRKGLTTRQLAESVGVVPATVLMYERERFPIPYQTAVAMAKVLEIDRNLLFDEFAQFMDYPYNDKLREVRKTYGLNQSTFAL